MRRDKDRPSLRLHRRGNNVADVDYLIDNLFSRGHGPSMQYYGHTWKHSREGRPWFLQLVIQQVDRYLKAIDCNSRPQATSAAADREMRADGLVCEYQNVLASSLRTNL